MTRILDKYRKLNQRGGGFAGELRATTAVITGSTETLVRQGWLYANGAAVSRATYAELFARIGTTYGTGNGSTTFNLPDYRGRSLSCALDGQAAGGTRMAATAGTAAGEENHPLTASETPRHVHGKGTLSISGGGHIHPQNLTLGSNHPSGGTSTTIGCCAWMSGSSGSAGSIVQGTSGTATHTHPSAELANATGNGSADSLAGTGHSNVAPVLGCAVMVAY